MTACGSPPPELTDEEKRAQEELEARDKGREYKPSDRAFGAKDFAGEAKDQTEQREAEAESAMDDTE